MGFHDFIRRKFRIRKNESPALIGAEIVRKDRSGKPDLAQSAIHGALFEIQDRLRFPSPVDLIVGDLEIGPFLLLHHQLEAALGQSLKVC